MSRTRIATTWLDGCSGCHMSLLDLDQRLLEIAPLIELVYSPLVDAREFPGEVAVTLVEGAVSSDEDIEKIRLIRERTRVLVSFGDCAVTSNVPAMRNEFGVEEVLGRSYLENATHLPQIPRCQLPRLQEHARPLHEYVKVDVFLPGCPPPAAAIDFVLCELLAGRVPDLTGKTRFGA